MFTCFYWKQDNQSKNFGIEKNISFCSLFFFLPPGNNPPCKKDSADRFHFHFADVSESYVTTARRSDVNPSTFVSAAAPLHSLSRLDGCEGAGDGPLPCDVPWLPAGLLLAVAAVPLPTCDAPELDEAAVDPPPLALHRDHDHTYITSLPQDRFIPTQVQKPQTGLADYLRRGSRINPRITSASYFCAVLMTRWTVRPSFMPC